MPGKGLRICVPSSATVTGSGSSVSIGKNGSVSFTSAVTLRINNVFSSTYDNYMMVAQCSVTGAFDLRFKLSKSVGTESSTGYGYQYLYANGTSVTAGRGTGSFFTMNTGASGAWGGSTDYIFAPFLSQPTTHICVGAPSGSAGPSIYDWAEIHTVTDSYDGILVLPDSSSPVSGVITIYGWVK